MPTVAFNGSVDDWVLSREIVYPPGCLARFTDFDYNRKLVHEGRKYTRDSRPYPGKAQLFNSLTSRDLVYESRSVWAPQYDVERYACPHSGTHGTVVDKRYYSAVSHTGEVVSSSSWIAQKTWADALRRRLQEDRVNLSSSVAEYRESVKMFVSLAKGLFSAYRDIRHGKIPRMKRNVNVSDIPANILRYNFGVAPLAEDLFSAVEILRLKLSAPITMRTSVSVKMPIEDLVKLNSFEFKVKGSVRQRATIYYDMDPSQYLSEYFDFGNPVEWVWELIPFSFVIDWVIPIGDYLGGLDALTGLSNIRGTVTTKNEQKWTSRWTEAEVIQRPMNGSFRSYQRDLILSVPAPLPRWTPSASWKKLLNASSILAQMRLNHFPKIKFLR